jgi:rhomboid protease GluP
MTTRIGDYVSKIRFVTLSLVTLNCVVYCIIFFTSVSINRVAISASQVLDGEYFRVVTSVFVHGGILHILGNMLTLLELGCYLESQFGSMKFAFLSVWSILATGFLYVLLSW